MSSAPQWPDSDLQITIRRILSIEDPPFVLTRMVTHGHAGGVCLRTHPYGGGYDDLGVVPFAPHPPYGPEAPTTAAARACAPASRSRPLTRTATTSHWSGLG